MSEHAFVYMHCESIEGLGLDGGLRPAPCRSAAGVEGFLWNSDAAALADVPVVVGSVNPVWDEFSRQIAGHATPKCRGLITRPTLSYYPVGDLVRLAVPVDLLPLTWLEVAARLAPDLAQAVERAARRLWLADPASWRLSEEMISLCGIAHLESVYEILPGNTPTWARLHHGW